MSEAQVANVFISLPDRIRAQAAACPEHAALLQDGDSVNYGVLDRMMDRVAATLQRAALAPRDIVSRQGNVCGSGGSLAPVRVQGEVAIRSAV